MEIRDPIHGFVELEEHEERLVNHPFFQRLHRIHQLAMAYLVYPGATHTRFEHSLGVCHIANMLAARINLKPDHRRRVRLAALLHDIGHGPFSHVSELILTACNENLPVGEAEGFHERISLSAIRRLHNEGFLGKADLDGVENVLVPDALGKRATEKGGDQPPIRNVCRDIVSGPLDADKMDYLLRDSYYAGVQYGVYDLDRLAHAVTHITEKPNSYLGVKEEGVSAVDQFIIANHSMRVQVYGHRIRRIADLMLVRSVVAAIEDENKQVKEFFTYEESDEFFDRYMIVDDAEIVRLVLSHPGGFGKYLMSRLVDRRLPKEILELPLDELSDPELVEKLAGKETERATTKELEQQLSEHLPIGKSDFVVVEVRRDRPVRATKGEAPVDPSAIMVKLREGGTDSYDHVSRFFRHGGFADQDHLSVWVTIDEPDRDRREVLKSELRRSALEVIGVKEADDEQA